MSLASMVGDGVQDLIVPDLKALQQRVEVLKTRMNERFAGLEKRTSERFAEVDRRFNDIDKRFDRAEREAERRHAELISYLSLEARVRKIEAEHSHETQKSPSGLPQGTRS